MSDIASNLQVVPTASQLPVSTYLEQQVLDEEVRLLFDAGPGYVGHELMVPETGCYRSIEWSDHSHFLYRTPEGVSRMSNVCRHRQAIMLEGSGKADHVVCPIHRWTYNQKGELLGAPRFTNNPCLNLNTELLENWQGLLFKGPRSARVDLEGLNMASAFDFSTYRLDRVVIHECNYNWKTFIEVYLEDYHVAPFHPGLSGFVTCDDLSWQFGEWYSVQRVGITSLAKPGTKTYSKWHESVRALYGDQLPPHGAIWLTYFPNVMVEWYPHVLVVSSLIPVAVDKTINVVEFYYPEEIFEFEREFIEAEQAAYMETAHEDDEIAERMDRGRRALYRQGRNEVGPYQSPLEDGMQHFHEFYRKAMGLPA